MVSMFQLASGGARLPKGRRGLISVRGRFISASHACLCSRRKRAGISPKGTEMQSCDSRAAQPVLTILAHCRPGAATRPVRKLPVENWKGGKAPIVNLEFRGKKFQLAARTSGAELIRLAGPRVERSTQCRAANWIEPPSIELRPRPLPPRRSSAGSPDPSAPPRY